MPDNGQVKRMNRTIKEATVKRHSCQTHEDLCTHLSDFVSAYDFARRQKTLESLSPCKFIREVWTKEPSQFILNPPQKMPGLTI